MASYIGYSPQRTTLFKAEQEVWRPRKQYMRLRQDNEVRWGSTLQMILRGLDLRDPIESYIRHTVVSIPSPTCLANSAVGPNAPVDAPPLRLMALRISVEQWDALEELAKFLMPFNAVTLATEGSLYPTASRVVLQYNELMDSLEKIRDSTTSPPSVIMRKCIDASLGKLQEYYYSSSDELCVATFLDPAFKLGYFELEDGSSNMGRAVSHVPSEEVVALCGLEAMAKDYLAIPATSAASERLFSQGRNLITWQRHRLGAERVEACMTLKLWIASYPGTPLGKAAKVAMVDDKVGVDLDEEF
ncbi:unnamed protein product [Closterium sp. NIES-65]|nr:unnamed protein product [Closterium sp. NIES-65]